MQEVPLDWIAVTILGSMTGGAELLYRHRTAPLRLYATWSAIAYIALNAIASALALWVIRAANWTFDAPGSASANLSVVYQVAFAGLGAMAFLRAAITVNSTNPPLTIGPSYILDPFIDRLDRHITARIRTAEIASVSATMADVEFEQAYALLPKTCFLFSPAPVAEEEQHRVAAAIGVIAQSGQDGRVKALQLGIVLADSVGVDALTQAVAFLGGSVTKPTQLAGPAW